MDSGHRVTSREAPARRPAVERSLRAIALAVLAGPPVLAVAACRGNHLDFDTSDASAEASAARPPKTYVDAGACSPVEIDAAVLDEDLACVSLVRLPCGLPQDAELRKGCLPSLEKCGEWCPGSFTCKLAPGLTCDDAGALIPDAAAGTLVECVECSTGAGRRPRGLAVARHRRSLRSTPLGEYFAKIAYLEAASVIAFRDLGRVLASLDAPSELRAAAAEAVQDERRHAATTRRLAREHGVEPPRPRVVTARAPSLEELLIDNVVEGCVGESFGALVAMWQSERATDPTVAEAMREIATDEARHAQLSWDLLQWGLSQPGLGEGSRERIRARLQRALGDLRRQIAEPVDASIIARAGHPSLAFAAVLAERFEHLVNVESERLLAA